MDIRPTREFPVDPANEAGFDNSAESLAMSPALVKKYLEAARNVADHLFLKPDGFAFAPHPMLADTDRDKYCVKAIIDFYKRQKTDYADYFLAAWRYPAPRGPRSARCLAGCTSPTSWASAASTWLTVWSTLNDGPEDVGPDRRASGALERAARAQGRRPPRRRWPAASRCGTSSSASVDNSFRRSRT